jgi:hypothetical protein
MGERGAFEDAMDAAFANVKWMQVSVNQRSCPPKKSTEHFQVREEKSSKNSSETFFYDAQGRRFNDLHGECGSLHEY